MTKTPAITGAAPGPAPIRYSSRQSARLPTTASQKGETRGRSFGASAVDAGRREADGS
jgi:hypothetical protein